MNAVIFAPQVPAVYLSPQAIAPLSASTTPIALALSARVDLADPAATTNAKLSKQDQQSNTLLNQKQTATSDVKRIGADDSSAPNNQAIALDGRVDVYV